MSERALIAALQALLEIRFSSSDGKRYPVGVDSPEARAVSRYFGRGRGVTFYVWTSDQHTHYATRVVRTTIRNATYVLDGILDNQTELPIEKHTTDTAGYSDIIRALRPARPAVRTTPGGPTRPPPLPTRSGCANTSGAAARPPAKPPG